MRKKDIFFYVLISALIFLFLWQWLSKGSLISQLNMAQKHNSDLQLIAGIGALDSAHLHADVKVYINGQTIDFSQQKYQLRSRFIHFEDGIGDVIHTHAAGLTLGHMLKSVGIDFTNDGDKKLKFYVNGQPNSDYDNYVIKDLDKYLISYGEENESEIKNQIDSVTNLALRYSQKN